LEFGNISVSNEAISDICKVILNVKNADCKKAKKNLVMALNNSNSALRKLLDINSTVYNKSHFHKMLQDNGYSKNDFYIYKTEVVNSICKIVKINCSRKNQLKLFWRCVESFRQNEISISPTEIVISGEGNKINENTVVCVKKRLFIDSTPQKENNNTSNIIVKKLENDLTEKILEIKEHNIININPGLLNSSFSIDDGCCSTIKENEYNKNVDSIKQIDVAEKMFTTPKRKLSVTFSGDLFTPEKRFKSISICNTPEADLKALPKNSKNVYLLKVRSFNEDNKMKKVICYKKCNFVEGTISLQDKELKQIVDN